MITKKSD